MTALLALTLAASALSPVEHALQRALAVPGGRVELRTFRGPQAHTCAVESAEVGTPLVASGKVAVRLLGEHCEAWGWAEARVFAKVLLAARALREGDPLEGATRLEERELHRGQEPLRTLPEAARAARAIPAGTALEQFHLHSEGPTPGSQIKVEVHAGPLIVMQTGRAVPCTRGHACAVLPSGRRVEGVMQAGHLLVETP
jgi:hypothetical protein